MKIAISIMAPESNASLDPRFGRAPAFAVVDTESGQPKVLLNPAQHAAGGAGVQAAELMVKQGVKAVISGAFGPKAFNVLRAANIEMYQAQSGTVGELIAKFQHGDLRIVEGS